MSPFLEKSPQTKNLRSIPVKDFQCHMYAHPATLLWLDEQVFKRNCCMIVILTLKQDFLTALVTRSLKNWVIQKKMQLIYLFVS